MAFRGWRPEALEFFEGLEADNSKTYWTANKPFYDEKVYGPMAELLAELEPEFGPGKIFRPYRDVRFSADKSPYKTNIAASLERGGYIHLSASGLAAGNGMYMMAPDQLDRYRRAVADDATGDELRRLIDAVEKRKIEVTGHESLKTVPKGYPKDHPRADLLRNKGLVAWKEWPAAGWLGKPVAKERVGEFLRASEPLSTWLAANVGPSTAAGRGR
jgi:uncharacterized protein (TIGR02453 family)